MKKITDINQLDLNKVYSYADYLLWKFEERVELFNGKVFPIAQPNRLHQEISRELVMGLYPFIKKNNYHLFFAPFDGFPKESKKDEDIFTVIQPDISVFCSENNLDERGGIGTLDLIIEILLAGNSKKELKNKFELYEESGVREYWIVNPLDEVVYVHTLENGKYKGAFPITDDYIHSEIFPEIKIHTDEVFKT